VTRHDNGAGVGAAVGLTVGATAKHGRKWSSSFLHQCRDTLWYSAPVGPLVGDDVGELVGAWVGDAVGAVVGAAVGAAVVGGGEVITSDEMGVDGTPPGPSQLVESQH